LRPDWGEKKKNGDPGETGGLFLSGAQENLLQLTP